jgi:hypothetical protein
MLDLVTTNNGFDGLLNGDDHITAKVIDAALNGADSPEGDYRLLTR